MAYTYLIGWSQEDRWYYGSRSKRGCCDPAGLWVTYFTSSKLVADCRIKYGEPDIIQIRKQFLKGSDAVEYEYKVLRRLKAATSTKWLNQHNGGKKFSTSGVRPSDERIEAFKRQQTGRVVSEETRRKLSEVRKRSTPWNKGMNLKDTHPHWMQKEAWNKGKTMPPESDATRAKKASSQTGKVWWNNGVESYRTEKAPGPDWIRGRLPWVRL